MKILEITLWTIQLRLLSILKLILTDETQLVLVEDLIVRKIKFRHWKTDQDRDRDRHNLSYSYRKQR